jgi:hypothetical protein
LGRKPNPGGSVDEARKRAGLRHPLGHRGPVNPDSPRTRLNEDHRPEDDGQHVKGVRQLGRIAREVSTPGLDTPKLQQAPKASLLTKGGKPVVHRKDRPNYGVGQGKGSGGRKQGAGNAMPRILKELIFTAMDMVGRDGRGKDKAAGYLARVAIRHPEIFGRFVEKMIPYTMTGPDGGPVQVTYDNKDDIVKRMRERGMPIPKALATNAGNPKGTARVTDDDPDNLDVNAVQSILETPVREHILERSGEDEAEDAEILPGEDEDDDNDDRVFLRDATNDGITDL